MRNKLFVRKTSQMKNKWAIYSIFALIFPILLIAIACTSGDSEPTPESAMEPTQSPEQLSVITTIYPMTYFSQRVGGERVNVESLIKAGVDAHDFEPTSGDIIKIGEADVLVFNHPAFESWVQDAVVAAENESLIVVKAADIADDAVLAHAHDHGHDEHDDKEAKLVEQLSHVIEEVEHGDISADDGLVEIEEVLHQFEGDHEGHDDHESHEDAEHKEDDDHEAHEDEHAHDEHLDELIEQLEEIVRRTETGAVSADAVIEEIHKVCGDGPPYVSFDVDGLDPVFAPGTGTPEVGGFTTLEAQIMLRGLRGLNLVGGDVVEVAPPFDPSGTTALTGATMMFEILCLVAESVAARRG